MSPVSFAGRVTFSRGTLFTEMFASLDWLPTFVEIAGGPKEDGLKKRLEAGSYPAIVKTTLDGVNQIDYLTGKSDQSARDVFYYFSGATPSAVRYKNWKMYYTMSESGAEGWILPLIPFHWTLVQNIKRDPFEQAVGTAQKSAMSLGGALAAPATAYQYDWNMLPIGQQLWLDWFETLGVLLASEDVYLRWDETSVQFSKAKIRFQSFFMLMTTQPSFFASS